MLESDDLKRITYKLVEFINDDYSNDPVVNFDIFTSVIDRYSGNESYSSSDLYEKIILMQLDYIDKQKERR